MLLLSLLLITNFALKSLLLLYIKDVFRMWQLESARQYLAVAR